MKNAMASAKKEGAKRTFEQSLDRLEKIVDSLERGETPLENAIELYEEGIALSKECMETLSKAELKIKKLSKDMNNKIELMDFE
ncbi:MAG TPA: exodeoxyribonuclease VII small subunit [Bacteroidota bacterium]|nr:exodeoxyribonuclease VII small subunit [Bacteroidota bacterium]